jgi:hypothetical protein
MQKTENTSSIVSDVISRKKCYETHCQNESSIPIFSQPWWLDTVCGKDNWDVAVVERGDSVVGSMPYYKRRFMGLLMLTQPPLTQMLGHWISPSEAKYAKALGREMEVMNELIDRLPKFDYFLQHWHYRNTNWLPFHQNGFNQVTRYSYIVEGIEDQKGVWNGLKENIRTDIRKAENRFRLNACDDLSIDDFLELIKMTYKRQGLQLPHEENAIRKLDRACKEQMCRKIWIARDEDGRHHAGVYVIWDKNSAYYLMAGANPTLKNSGAMSFITWEAIKHAATVTNRFDFMGSMISRIERYFRGFGAIQTPYFKITKTNSILLKLTEKSIFAKRLSGVLRRVGR